MSEKSVEQWHPVLVYEDGDERVEMEFDPDGGYVKTHDHQEALGEAEKERDDNLNGWIGAKRHVEEVESVAVRRYEENRAAEQSLQTLRSEIAHVRGHLEGYADVLDSPAMPLHPDRLSKALREDAEKLKLSAETAGAE